MIFSRNRAAQLDLLLESLALNAGGLFSMLRVLWLADEPPYEQAYAVCASSHPEAGFVRQAGFSDDLSRLLQGEQPVSFFTDDSVLFRPLAGRRRLPAEWLDDDDVLCFSLRLGLNCRDCYPLAREQRLPEFRAPDDETLTWEWRGADADFGYPASLDGHFFRSSTVRDLVAGGRFSNPNTLEEMLAGRILAEHRPLIASYRESHLVGIPANRVNETHPNRYGESWPLDERLVNDRYLRGDRLDLSAVSADAVTGAHVEIPLRWRRGGR